MFSCFATKNKSVQTVLEILAPAKIMLKKINESLYKLESEAMLEAKTTEKVN